MLVQFAIETAAINDSATPAHIRRLLDLWKRFGILVYPGQRDTVIRKTIENLTPRPRKLWQSTWAKVIKNNGRAFRYVSSDGVVFDWESIDTTDALAASSDEFELAILEEKRAIVLDIPDGESRSYGQVEGVRLWDIDSSEKFSRSEELSSEPIGIGESIKDIWIQRFQRLAAYSGEVVVVDQYATRYRNVIGLIELLKLLNQDAKCCRVTVYSSVDDGGSKVIEARIRAETEKITGKGVRSVSIHLVENSDFQKYAHDRHIRFGNSVVRIGRGIRIFEGRRVLEATDVGLLILKPGTRERKEVDLGRVANIVHTFQVPAL